MKLSLIQFSNIDVLYTRQNLKKHKTTIKRLNVLNNIPCISAVRLIVYVSLCPSAIVRDLDMLFIIKCSLWPNFNVRLLRLSLTNAYWLSVLLLLFFHFEFPFLINKGLACYLLFLTPPTQTPTWPNTTSQISVLLISGVMHFYQDNENHRIK